MSFIHWMNFELLCYFTNLKNIPFFMKISFDMFWTILTQFWLHYPFYELMEIVFLNIFCHLKNQINLPTYLIFKLTCKVWKNIYDSIIRIIRMKMMSVIKIGPQCCLEWSSSKVWKWKDLKMTKNRLYPKAKLVFCIL